jgi:creatinine amidohydrolase
VISLSANRIKKIIILNGHHGNLIALKRFEGKIKKNIKNTKISVLSYWHYMKDDFDHAGHVETSLMLAISKNIKMQRAKKGLITDKLDKKEILRINKLASKSFPKATKNGVWGDPTLASAKQGKKILKQVVDNLIKESNLSN